MCDSQSPDNLKHVNLCGHIFEQQDIIILAEVGKTTNENFQRKLHKRYLGGGTHQRKKLEHFVFVFVETLLFCPNIIM